MRLEALKPISIKNQILGGAKPLVCIPLVGKTREEILKEANNVPVIAPDIIELRVDAWDFIEDVEKSIEMTGNVRAVVGDIPIIFTCRGDWEGGFKTVSDEAKFAIYTGVVIKGLVDYVDVEVKYGKEKIQELRTLLEDHNMHLIVSFHNFKSPPAKEEIVSLMEKEIEAGAHVAKLAVMPMCEEDVLNLLSATLAVRRKHPDIPIITMSMGSIGAVTRIVGGLFGSDLSFAVGSKASAPGQIPIDELRNCYSVIYTD